MTFKKAVQIIQIVFGILLGAAIVIFIISNKQLLSLKFLQYETSELWSSAIVLLSFLLGMFMMLLISIWVGLGKFRKNRTLSRENQKLEKKIVNLEEQLGECKSAANVEGQDKNNDINT